MEELETFVEMQVRALANKLGVSTPITGKELIPLDGELSIFKVMEAVGRKFDIAFEWDTFDWSCEVYKKTGKMMPDDGLDQIRKHDAIYLGAVGFPGVPDHVSLWGLLIPIRREFQQSTWQAFWQTYVDGRSCKDVARALQVSTEAVYMAKGRVLSRLREKIRHVEG